MIHEPNPTKRCVLKPALRPFNSLSIPIIPQRITDNRRAMITKTKLPIGHPSIV